MYGCDLEGDVADANDVYPRYWCRFFVKKHVQSLVWTTNSFHCQDFFVSTDL